jgi:hypothetical protein
LQADNLAAMNQALYMATPNATQIIRVSDANKAGKIKVLGLRNGTVNISLTPGK